jgi:hypothetical protein
MRTARQAVLQAAGGLVDDWIKVVSGPCVVCASIDALQRMNGPMTFLDSLAREASFLKLAIDIAREHERAMLHA